MQRHLERQQKQQVVGYGKAPNQSAWREPAFEKLETTKFKMSAVPRKSLRNNYVPFIRKFCSAEISISLCTLFIASFSKQNSKQIVYAYCMMFCRTPNRATWGSKEQRGFLNSGDADSLQELGELREFVGVWEFLKKSWQILDFEIQRPGKFTGLLILSKFLNFYRIYSGDDRILNKFWVYILWHS